MNVVEVRRERAAGANNLRHHPHGKGAGSDRGIADRDFGKLIVNEPCVFLDALRHPDGVLGVHGLIVRDFFTQMDERLDVRARDERLLILETNRNLF